MSYRSKYKYTLGKPLNREPEIEKLLSSFLTKNGGYDRNHSPIPQIDPSSHVLRIDGAVLEPLNLSMSQLETEFEQHQVLCCLQCAGNRRHTMRTEIKEVQGIDWFDGAVMNCLWKGPRLRDIILRAGIAHDFENEKGYKGHVALACYEQPCEDSPDYGGSVSLARAMLKDGDCILALEASCGNFCQEIHQLMLYLEQMNGKPLTPAHGAPVRALMPGILGARSVKWLNRITLQKEESANFYQQKDYKILPPEAFDSETAKGYWDMTPSMSDMPVNSIIGLPKSGSTLTLGEDGGIEVTGYAVPKGMDGPVAKVEVSGDDGNTWVEAELSFGGFDKPGLSTAEGRKKVRWAWCVWKARVRLERGSNRRLLSRCIDWKGNVQPQKSEWNLRGVGFNAWGEIKGLTIL